MAPTAAARKAYARTAYGQQRPLSAARTAYARTPYVGQGGPVKTRESPTTQPAGADSERLESAGWSQFDLRAQDASPKAQPAGADSERLESAGWGQLDRHDQDEPALDTGESDASGGGSDGRSDGTCARHEEE